MTYSESRARYAETLNSVTDDREEVIVTRAGHDPVVIAAGLRRAVVQDLASIDRLESGSGAAHELADP